jgi:chromosome segregation ATPase
VPDGRAETLLAHVRELERRDQAHAALLETLTELATRVDRIRSRAATLSGFLERLPADLARLEHAAAAARDARAEAARELERAETRLAELEGRRRPDEEELAAARRAVAAAREALADAEQRVERLAARRAGLLEEERGARVETGELAGEAAAVASALAGLGQLSQAAKEPPGEGLDGLVAWGERAHTGLFVARGAVETERERTVREANELGAAVLGEPLGGSGVSLVRQRLERALAP